MTTWTPKARLRAGRSEGEFVAADLFRGTPSGFTDRCRPCSDNRYAAAGLTERTLRSRFARGHASGHRRDRPRGFFDDLADLRLADDQRRRQNKRVANGAQEKIEIVESAIHRVVPSLPRGTWLGPEINCCAQPGVADIEDIG